MNIQSTKQGQPQPRFSVVIATMNRSRLVLEAVRSVVEQTDPPHEIIVVDDGSSDGTADAVRGAFPQVRVIEQDNAGESAARNAGIVEATGNWLGFLDDDDMWHRDKLRLAAEHLRSHPDCAAINNPHWYFSESESGPSSRLGIGRHFVADGFDACQREADERGIDDPDGAARLRVTGDSFDLMLERNRGVFSSTLVRRDVLMKAGLFMPNASYGEDWLMFVNVARFAEWHTLPYRLGFTRLHAVQQTGGSAMGGYQSLTGFLAMWYLGRPMPFRTKNQDFADELARFGPVYRRIVHGFVRLALRQYKPGRAIAMFVLGSMLLPRWRDRLYVWLPRPLAWRWDKRSGALPRGAADETQRWPALHRPRETSAA